MKEKIELKNLPDKIWIQVGEIDIDFDNDFKKLRESNEVTWCEHKIDNWDIEYTRSSLIESLINQEVEKRIAERMPSEDDGRDRIPYPDKPTELKHYQNIGFIRGWRAAIKECRSRLTQKKEGGGNG